MKTRNFLAIAMIAAASFTGQVVGQETKTVSTKGRQTQGTNFGDRVNAGLHQAGSEVSDKSSGWDLRTTEVRIVATADGCDIVCDSSTKNKRDVASGQSTGRRLSIACCDHSATATEQKCAAGKHFSKADISSRQGAGGGTGKVNVQDISFSVKNKGKIIPITVNNDSFSFPEDCPDGTYDVACSWSWGASNASTQKAIDCHLKIENGVCVDMAINEKGTSATKK